MSDLNRRSIVPMKASPGELPSDDGRWTYEIKWDGMRVLAFVTDAGVRLASANDNDTTAAFPELAGLIELGAGLDGLILDGEVVALGPDGLPSFKALQHRMHVSDPLVARARAVENPVTFVIFDLLHLDGHDTMSLALTNRRTLLEGIVDTGAHWRLTDQFASDPVGMLESITAKGMEGIIAKRLDSIYRPGSRAKTWRKIKPTYRQEFVVGGWTEGRDGNSDGLGSLLVGVYGGATSGLQHCGSVGSGLDSDQRSWWKAELEADATDDSPFENPIDSRGRILHFAAPRKVIDVAFGEWTGDERLRFPVYLGLRNDKDPADVVREV